MTILRANGLLLLVAIVWGASFTLVKDVLDEVSPALFLAWRFSVAALAFWVLFHRRFKKLNREEVAAGVFLGVVNATGFLLQTIGLKTTTAGKAGFLTGAYVVFVPLLSASVAREQVRMGQWVGVLVTIVGMAFLSLKGNFEFVAGDLWVMGSTLFFSLQVLGVSRFAKDRDPVRLTGIQILVMALSFWIMAFLIEHPTFQISVHGWTAIWVTALFATIFAFSIQMWAQPFTSATSAALLMAMEAVFAALIGWGWRQEVLTSRELLGCSLMLLGMLLAQIQWRKEAKEIYSTL